MTPPLAALLDQADREGLVLAFDGRGLTIDGPPRTRPLALALLARQREALDTLRRRTGGIMHVPLAATAGLAPHDQHDQLTTDEAYELTARIRGALDHSWRLITEARDRGAWRALGYVDWPSYLQAEFGMTDRNGRYLLNQGRVILAIEGATGSAFPVHVSAREAAVLRPHLAIVTDAVRRDVEAASPDADPADVTRATIDRLRREYGSPAPATDPDDVVDAEVIEDGPPAAVDATAAALLKALDVEVAEREARLETPAARAEQRRDYAALAEQARLREVDERAEAARLEVVHDLFRAVHALASLPSPAMLIGQIRDVEQYRLADLPAAGAWLAEFAARWEGR